MNVLDWEPSAKSLEIRGCCIKCYGNEDEGCIEGRWYGLCSSENCYGLCEFEGPCGCECHAEAISS